MDGTCPKCGFKMEIIEETKIGERVIRRVYQCPWCKIIPTDYEPYQAVNEEALKDNQ